MKNTKELQSFISNLVRTRTDADGEKFTHRSFGKAVGVSHATVSRWISGTAKDIDDENAEKLAELAGISLLELLQISYGIEKNSHLFESNGNYGDKFDSLCKWLRTEASERQRRIMLDLAKEFDYQNSK